MKARKNRKWIYVLLGLLLCCFPVLVWGGEAPVENVVEMKVHYGFQNNIKSNSAVPVKVEVTCISGSVSGKIQVEVPVQSEGNLNASIWMSDVDGSNNKEQCYRWEQEFILEEEESAIEIFYIELPMYESYFNVSVTNGKKTLAKKTVLCDCAENNAHLLMGVLSEDKKEINQLNGMQIGENTHYNDEVFVKTLSLGVEDIYENPLALEQLDILIVDKGTEFTREQKNSIAIWEQNGGLYYEREGESLQELLFFFKTGEYADRFQALLDQVGSYHSYNKNFDHIPLKEKVPIGRYIFLILLYLVVIGPGLYWMLRGKKEPYWLIGSVCGISFGFIFIVYLVGRSINMGTPAICHETLYEQDGNYLKETIGFSVQAYQMQDFELVLNDGYEIFPKSLGMGGAQRVDVQSAETITFQRDSERNTMLLEHMSAYRQNCFSMEKYKVLREEEQITFKIHGNGDTLQIRWNNPTSYFMRQAIVVLENRIAVVGDVKPQSHGIVEQAKLYAYSDNAMSMPLKALLDFSDSQFPEYEIENLSNKIWEMMYDVEQRKDGAFVIGILGNEQSVFQENIGFDVYGTALLKIAVDIDWVSEQRFWCPNLETYGTVYKGEYSAAMNLLESKEAIVDYQTSHIGELVSLEFFPADYHRLEHDIAFDGKIYVFNWQMGMFNEFLFWKENPYEDMLGPYISDTGVLRVYYVMDEELANSNRSCVLPCIKASGKVE